MTPALKNGDRIFVQYVPFEKIKNNDIISFYKDSIVVTHRVSKTKDTFLITMGDHNKDEDKDLVYPKDLVGRYLFTLP